MPGHIYTIEELMLDDSFISYCLSTGAAVPSKWRKIIRDNPEQEKTFEDAKKIVLTLHGGLGRIEVNRQIEIVRQQLKQRNNAPNNSIQQEESPPLSSDFVISGKGEIKRKIVKKILAYAAAASLLVAAGWWFFPKSTAQNEKPLAQAMNYQSPLGQRQTISLPDGSEVILNSNSQISLGAGYNKTKREIYLTGDAFFKVAKDAAKPFTVYAGNIATTALGTEFYVYSKKEVKVDLLEGKVEIREIGKNKEEASLVLFPGETGRIGTAKKFEKASFDSLHLRTWLNGRLSFNETPLPKVLKQLEAWYGIEIKVKKSELKDISLNGDYPDASLQDILKVICFSLHSDYTFIDNTVTIE